MYWIVDITSKKKYGWYVPKSLLKAQGYGSQSQSIISMWLPYKPYKVIPSKIITQCFKKYIVSQCVNKSNPNESFIQARFQHPF